MDPRPSTSRDDGEGNDENERRNRGRRPGDELHDQPREKQRRTADNDPRSSSSKRSPKEESSADGKEQGKGDNRQRRQRYEIVQSKPHEVVTKCGTEGTKIQLQANYFRILKRPEWNIYQYHVDFSPPIELNRLKRGILSNFRAQFGGYIFDGTQLYVTQQLSSSSLELETQSRQGETYKILIKYVAIVQMTDWKSLQVLNLILRRSMEGLNLQLVGRNFFDALARIEMRNFNLQLWPGYITSIRQHEKDILVCAEVAHKVMRTETLYDIMRQTSRNARNDWQEEFRRLVIGTTVLTDYNNKTYRIDDVDFGYTPSKTFEKKGREISFQEYYYEKYQIRIRDAQQPLLISQNRERRVRAGAENNVMLIPELCRATGMTEDMRKNFQALRAIDQFTKPDPNNRIEKLMRFNGRLRSTETSKQILRDWNLELEDSLVNVDGRILEPEFIYLSDGNKLPAGPKANWEQAFKGRNGMYISIPLKNWVAITPANMERETRNFVDHILRAARGMGMNVLQPNYIILQDDRGNSYQKALDAAANEDPQMILVSLFSNAADKYGIIKKRCCIDLSIPTQVITKRIMSKNVLSIATKVCIQMNAKIGGCPWMISLPVKGLMVCGYDICKSTRDKNKVYAALVATMDQKIEKKYFSTVTRCDAHDFLSNDLEINMIKAIREYIKTHNTLPSRILIYRDSVGDGSLKHCFEHEVKNLIERIKEIYSEHKITEEPKLTFIVVSKTCNTRFFEVDSRNQADNPPPGTVVDDVVTLPERYDFYLISQSVFRGTASPTNYNVLHDTSKLKPDYMQLLTYKMCHLYYNWNGTTRVPAVLQYAKKLATLVAEHLHGQPSPMLEKQLYYI